jgi:hypothetical protein
LSLRLLAFLLLLPFRCLLLLLLLLLLLGRCDHSRSFGGVVALALAHWFVAVVAAAHTDIFLTPTTLVIAGESGQGAGELSLGLQQLGKPLLVHLAPLLAAFLAQDVLRCLTLRARTPFSFSCALWGVSTRSISLG